MDVLIDSLGSNDHNIICVALEALRNILKKGDDAKMDFQNQNIFLKIFSEKNGSEKLQDLQIH